MGENKRETRGNAPRIVLVACIGLLVAEACGIAWRNLRTSAPAAPSPMPARPAQLVKTSAAAQLAAILDAHLFGAAAADITVATDEGLQLVGSFVYDDPTLGLALLGNGDKVAVVRAGTMTPDGALVREIYLDHVVIERDGRLLSLLLQRREPLGSSPLLAALTASVAVVNDTPTPATVMRDISFTPPGIPAGVSFGSRLAMERDAHPPDLSRVPPPRPLPPDQMEPPRAQNR